MIEYNPPFLTLKIETGPGTYIRSLARDLGEKLGCGGAVKTLVRLRSGKFSIENAFDLDDMEKAYREGIQDGILINPIKIMNGFPKIIVNGQGMSRVRNGQPIDESHLLKELPGEPDSDYNGAYKLEKILIMNENGELLAVARRDENKNKRILCEKVFIAISKMAKQMPDSLIA